MRIIPLSAALAAVLLAAPVSAEPAAASRTEIVRTVDLDLGTAAGIATLDQRIRLAAETVCGPTSAVDLAGTNDSRHCQARLIAALRPQRDRLVEGAAGSTRLARR